GRVTRVGHLPVDLRRSVPNSLRMRDEHREPITEGQVLHYSHDGASRSPRFSGGDAAGAVEDDVYVAVLSCRYRSLTRCFGASNGHSQREDANPPSVHAGTAAKLDVRDDGLSPSSVAS